MKKKSGFYLYTHAKTAVPAKDKAIALDKIPINFHLLSIIG